MADTPDWVTLTEGERVCWQGRPTIYLYLGELLAGALLVCAGVGAWLVLGTGVGSGIPVPAGIPGPVVGGVLALLGVGVAAKALVERRSVRYLITSHEAYKKRGFVSREVTNLPLDRVQNTSFSQSVLGRVFSYGEVRIDTAGHSGTEMVFRHVDDPQAVVGVISEQLADAG